MFVPFRFNRLTRGIPARLRWGLCQSTRLIYEAKVSGP
jgi:hypothetical protein